MAQAGFLVCKKRSIKGEIRAIIYGPLEILRRPLQKESFCNGLFCLSKNLQMALEAPHFPRRATTSGTSSRTKQRTLFQLRPTPASIFLSRRFSGARLSACTISITPSVHLPSLQHLFHHPSLFFPYPCIKTSLLAGLFSTD